MAGDWIKMRTDLYRDPKVCLIADLLMDSDGDLARFVSQNLQCDMSVTRNVTRSATVGALVSVWGVLRHRGKRSGDDLSVRGCSISVIDDVADIPGFGSAMKSVGWVVETKEGLSLPRFFEEFNVDPADDAKQKSANRQRRYREKQKEKRNVTRDVTVAQQSNGRVEKSRVENIPPISPKGELWFPVAVGTCLDVPEFKAAWIEWQKHRREIRKKLTATAATQQLERLTAWGVPRAVAAIRISIAQGWEGIYEEKSGPNGKSPSPSSEVGYWKEKPKGAKA